MRYFGFCRFCGIFLLVYIALHGKKNFFCTLGITIIRMRKKIFLVIFINAEKLAAHPAQQKLGSKFLGKIYQVSYSLIL